MSTNLFSNNDLMFSKIRNLSSNIGITSLAESYGMKIMDIAWEDTARTKGSCFGPNISDMTLNVNGQNMPLIRKPNFADITSDQDISNFNLVVGNESGKEKKMVSLKEYLENIHFYTYNDLLKSMYLERDKKILTSAQACILPLENGEVEFNVKLYNYQSTSEPAVLVVVASSEGTSAQIVKGRDCTLHFNKDGKNANFIAERLSDDRKRRGVPLEGSMTNEEKQRNALLIFQIPLKISPPKTKYNDYIYFESMNEGYNSKDNFCLNQSYSFGSNYISSNNYLTSKIAKYNDDIPVKKIARGIQKEYRGFENAVIKTSESFGSFIGTEGRKLERDDSYPIRCTVQYYKVTDTIDISEAMIKEIAEQINKQYNMVTTDERGSLVMNDTNRITEPKLSKSFDFGTSRSMMNNL